MARDRRPQRDDAFTGWRKYLRWKPGELRKIKRRDAKQRRVRAREETREQAREEL